MPPNSDPLATDEMGLLLRLAPWMAGEPTDLRFWLDGMWRGQGTAKPAAAGPGIASAILERLAPFEGMIEALRARSDRPYCRLPFDYEFPFFSETHSEHALTALVRLVRLRASAELAVGRDEAAWRDLQLTLRLLEYQRQQPALYSQEQRAYAVADGLQPLWEGLTDRRWTASQIEAVQRQLRDFAPLEDFAARARCVALANAGFVESVTG